MSYQLMTNDSESDNENVEDDKGIRVLTIPRGDIGFGFNVRGQLEEGGPMKAINGELYGPLHHVTALLTDGSAEKSGLKVEDRILEINGIIVEGYMHKTVIEMLRSSSDPLVLTVIRPMYTRQENGNAETKEIPHITIPDHQLVEGNIQSHVVFNIYMNSRLTCCRRYSHFEKLLTLLISHFPTHNFPPLPGKKLFSLSREQLHERRRGLEKFLISVCSISEVFESTVVRQFLALESDDDDDRAMVTMKVLMPDHSLIEVKVHPEEQTEQIYSRVVNCLGLRTDVLPYFSLFEVTQDNFERKLTAKEYPYKLYLKHLSLNLSSGVSFKKWIFSLTREATICWDPLVLSLIHSQAIESIKRKEFPLGDRQLEVENLNLSGRRAEVMEVVRHLDLYDRTFFPHCSSDSRKNGHVVCSVSYNNFQLRACSVDGILEDNVLTFHWSKIESYEVLSDSFVFTFSREDKGLRTVTIKTKYSQYMLDCFDRIQEERRQAQNPSR